MSKPNRALDILMLTAIAAVVAICITGMMVYIKPLLVVAAIAIATSTTFDSKGATLLSLGGIAIYFASYPVSWIFGPFEGGVVLLMGSGMWTWGILHPEAAGFPIRRKING